MASFISSLGPLSVVSPLSVAKRHELSRGVWGADFFFKLDAISCILTVSESCFEDTEERNFIGFITFVSEINDREIC